MYFIITITELIFVLFWYPFPIWWWSQCPFTFVDNQSWFYPKYHQYLSNVLIWYHGNKVEFQYRLLFPNIWHLLSIYLSLFINLYVILSCLNYQTLFQCCIFFCLLILCFDLMYIFYLYIDYLLMLFLCIIIVLKYIFFKIVTGLFQMFSFQFIILNCVGFHVQCWISIVCVLFLGLCVVAVVWICVIKVHFWIVFSWLNFLKVDIMLLLMLFISLSFSNFTIYSYITFLTTITISLFILSFNYVIL